MDVSKLISCVLCLIVCIGLDIAVGQGFLGQGYPRRDYLRRGPRIYPRYPQYPGRPLYPRPGIMPVPEVLPLPGILPMPERRPNVVSDRSERTNLNLNIHNENNNVHDQRGSGRVSVSQGGGCERACPDRYCPNPFESCVEDSRCAGNYGCRRTGDISLGLGGGMGLMGGDMGFMGGPPMNIHH